jgi:putative peptidoglycan lipid II flippase
VVFSLAKVFVPAFYGLQDTKTPVKTGLLAVGLNLVLNITFILLLPKGCKHAGLAFATVLSSVFNMSCLAMILNRRIGGIGWGPVAATAARSAGASALMVSAILLFPLLRQGFGGQARSGQIVSLFISIGAGGAVYLVSSLLFRAPELREFVRALRSRA